MTSKQQHSERTGLGALRVIAPTLKASKVNPEKPKVWIPYIRFSGNRLPNGRREWALAWRTTREADLRGIWNNDAPLDKRLCRSNRKLALAITNDGFCRLNPGADRIVDKMKRGRK